MSKIDAPAEAKCAGCGHTYHFPLRCGYVIEPETEEDFSGRKCECLSDVKAAPVEDTAVEWAIPGDMKPMYLLRFDDSDMREMVFDNEAEAWKAWHQYKDSWNCWLFGPMCIKNTRTRELEKRLAEADRLLNKYGPEHGMPDDIAGFLSPGSDKTK